MSTIYGALGIGDRDSVADSRWAQVIWRTTNDYLAATEADTNDAYQVLVQPGDVTDKVTENYKLPGGGRMQSASNLTRPGAVKATGSWDVAYPIEDFRDQWASDEIALAYLTAEEMDRHVKNIVQRYVNTKRFLMLRAILNASNETVTDDVTKQSLTIRRLANADGTLFPPVIGSETELSGHSHYVGLNYTAINDTNNPFVTARDHLNEHFGDEQGLGGVVFINNAQRAAVEALTAFADRVTLFTNPADNDRVMNPSGLPRVPGKIIGACNDFAIVEWRWIPAGYMLAVALNQDAPLKRRVDIPESLRGFKLVAKQMEYPMDESFFRAREGYGVGNRLNGVAMQLVASTTYTTPTAYA